MIMRGTTPRSLSWPGCLAMLALGLTCLPMLPVLHGQAPDKEEANKLLEEHRKILDAAREQVERSKSLLAEKKAAVDRAESQLKAAEYQARAFQEQLEHRIIIFDLAKKEQAAITAAEERQRTTAAQKCLLPKLPGQQVAKKENYHIEITLPDNNSVESNVILQKILNVLPEKVKTDRSIVIRSVAVTNPTAVERPLPPAGKSSEDRISELEKKLEKVIHELHQMRKEMKPQGGPAGPKP